MSTRTHPAQQKFDPDEEPVKPGSIISREKVRWERVGGGGRWSQSPRSRNRHVVLRTVHVTAPFSRFSQDGGKRDIWWTFKYSHSTNDVIFLSESSDSLSFQETEAPSFRRG